MGAGRRTDNMAARQSARRMCDRTVVVTCGVLLIATFEIALSGEPGVSRPKSLLILRNATLVNSQPPYRREHVTARIQGDSIVDLSPVDSTSLPDAANVIDCTGHYLIPGLIEGHVHLQGFPDKQLEHALRWGITSIRSMADDAGYIKAVNEAIEKGELLGPSIFYSAVFAGGRLFEEDPRTRCATPDEYALGDAPWMRQVNKRSDIPSLVQDAKNCGATGIKLYNYLAPAQMRAISAEAHRHGLKVWSHPHLTHTNPMQLASAGVDSISHTLGLLAPDDRDIDTHGSLGIDQTVLNSGRLDEILDVMRWNRVALDTTCSVFLDMIRQRTNKSGADSLRNALAEVLKRAHAKGVALAGRTRRGIRPIQSRSNV